MRTVFTLATLLAGLVMATSAPAAELAGEWLRDSGSSHVRFVPCGDAICGIISWLRDADSPAKLGQKVFFDLKPAGDNVWTGQAFNPDDGKTYSGKVTLKGSTIITEGCVLFLCKSTTWTKL